MEVIVASLDIFHLQRGFDLLIVPDYLLFFLIFLKILHENGIILSQRGAEPALDPPLHHIHVIQANQDI